MINIIKSLLTLLCGIFTLYSCNIREAESYTKSFAVIKSSETASYFLSDDGFNLIPQSFKTLWGSDGDKVLLGFYYNPATVSTATNSININVETVIRIPTYRSVLPSHTDTVGTGIFLYDVNASMTTDAWIAQNYLTVMFWIKYTDASKHSFGFIEENDSPYRNDTLFLRLWHNANETNESKNSYVYMALNLDCYKDYLNYADSTIISLKYDAQNSIGTTEKKAGYVTYHRKSGN
jgi:hypothetical protein